MNVEEYFPEGLSVIQHDETKTSHTSSIDNSTSNVPLKVLSPIQQKDECEVPAMVYCHICYKNISDLINNVEYFKPCNCKLIYIHSSCVPRNKSKFGFAKCSSCGNNNTLPKTNIHLNKFDGNCESPSKNRKVCEICQNQRFQNLKKMSNEAIMVKPCFCAVRTHFGCISPLLNTNTACMNCQVIYREFEPASTRSFFWYYLCRYLTCFFLLLAISTILHALFYRSSFRTTQVDSQGILCSIFSVFFVVLTFTFVFILIKCTLGAIPKYQIGHGKLIVNPFKTKLSEPTKQDVNLREKNKKQSAKMSMKEVRARLNGVEKIEEARGEELVDMTLGQLMFGVNDDNHSSSTPIEKCEKPFEFESEQRKPE